MNLHTWWYVRTLRSAEVRRNENVRSVHQNIGLAPKSRFYVCMAFGSAVTFCLQWSQNGPEVADDQEQGRWNDVVWHVWEGGYGFHSPSMFSPRLASTSLFVVVISDSLPAIHLLAKCNTKHHSSASCHPIRRETSYGKQCACNIFSLQLCSPTTKMCESVQL